MGWLPASRPHAVPALARGRFFSRARRWNVSPCGEKDRGDSRYIVHTAWYRYHTGTEIVSVHRAYRLVPVPYWYRDSLGTPVQIGT
ncbi:hypothetical protein BHM03_00014527 [Ensete ventricosum]|nr:hypothetical protein BHM03_00014527 [Ensete ventricosum]